MNPKYEENIFSGEPSIKLAVRPFFSIIIPCYNSAPDRMQCLLESIYVQIYDVPLEVILVDDCSPDPAYIDQVVKEYASKMSIRQVKTEKESVHCPGNSRELGAQTATGQWITFSDHDDEFVPGGLKIVMDAIMDKKEKYCAWANFNEVDPITKKIEREMIHTSNWMHAKFYNLDNFWKARNIHFKKDLVTHEDIYVSTYTRFALNEINPFGALLIDATTYLWKAWPDSVSRTKYAHNTFLEEFFEHYVISTAQVCLDLYQDPDFKDKQKCINGCIDSYLFMYFYIQGFKFRRPTEYIYENIIIGKSYLRKILTICNITKDYILKKVSEHDALWYNKVREAAIIGVGNFIETDTLKQFMEY